MGDALDVLAHALLATPFAASGVEKALNWAAGLREVAALERQIALAPPASALLWIVIAVQLVGAVLLMIPPLSGLGAAMLIAFLVPTTLVAHPFWRAPRAARAAMRNHFLLNVGLAGGLLLVAAGTLR